ncbi:hypothetical protein FPANT_11505 [Fusarium pseudoanthophilum]|uniref:Uncharacterized protein n=1 Tax=Fusarium pseudoanthophilum TaxID=48495 RepID=A0A8H5KIS7_9HYPO|nr:hypothetical protein FPANT_11505 [Fusarium pseudoanthophilum]
MMQDNKSETGQEVQETRQTVHHHQQPSLKDTGSESPHSQNEPFFDDSPTSTKPTRTQVARETVETYNNYRDKRKTKDLSWWGSKQHEAERGNPDREFQFARNMPVSNDDIKSAQKAYNARITDPATGIPNPLGPHLRPTTPPMEKAEKQIKDLEEQGVNVTPGLREEVAHHYISNNGLHAALLIWCRNKEDVPVQYVNEYIKSMSRLKLEMATQQRDVTEKLGQALKECEARESRCQKLQAENSKLNMEIQRLKQEKEKTDIQASPLVTTQDIRQPALYPGMTAVGQAEEKKAHLEDSSMQYDKHSIPPTSTVHLPGTPLTSARDASESDQSPPVTSVTRESLEKKPWSAESAKSNVTQDDACRNRVKELELKLQNLKEELRVSNGGTTVQGKPNYTTVDSLVNAVRNQNQGIDDQEEAPNLVDRINYLNLVCFFRTRNYLQLALREGDHTLAKILLNDADKWVKSCKEFLQTMDPEVNLQVEGSMLILHGMRQVLTTKDENVLIEGVKYVKHGRNELTKLPKSDSFAQLVQLADSILHATKYDEKENCLGIKGGLPFNPFRRKKKSQYTKIQGTIKDGPAMKAESLRLTGIHSPLSPQKFRRDR